MGAHRRNIRKLSLAGTAMAGALGLMAAPAYAQEQTFELDVPSQRLDTALRAFAQQSRQQLMFAVADTKGFNAPALNGSYTADQAIGTLLAGTGLEVHRNAAGVFLIASASDPQSGSAAGGGAEVEALIVTAQKREEDIQDVPIAISAFTQETLERSQVAGGPDLMTQVPNMTFTKTNFTSYSIQLRGIGTQAISATTDAAVAVAFNNTPFIRNRFFEQEFYDLQRVEVLRGPQGTLYGRNATAGVVNIISAKPTFNFEAKASADVANYNSTRLEGMVNVPLVEDAVALRLAGAWTKRDGFVTNENNGEQTDGRDLWSTRLSLRFAPTDRIEANLIWEHFEEDDDRLRSGKQLCHTDEVTEVAGFPTTHYQTLPLSGQEVLFAGVQGTFSQGCKPASLYAPESFQVPSGLSVPYYGPLAFIRLPVALDDPYASRTQSTDLRVIQSSITPIYRAKSDVAELQVRWDLSDALTLASETAYATDTVFASQDFNRFNTAPGAWTNLNEDGTSNGLVEAGVLKPGPNGFVFCDPQIGCSDRLAAADLSAGESTHFSQEFRLASDLSGGFNFSIGANYLRYDTTDKYYVFINSLTMLNAMHGSGAGGQAPYVSGVSDNIGCLRRGGDLGDPSQAYPLDGCTYIDPNPIGSLNDRGHNYFLSTNPYKLISYAIFGETYYNITDDLKLTAGLRWTVDKKQAPRVPSWLLVPNTVGYPVEGVSEQEWREPTGRLAIDWKPDLSFTDETLVYASFAHGYKAGGANPPPYAVVYYSDIGGGGSSTAGAARGRLAQSATRPKTFDPEFINAFELGAKNTLADGRVTLNLSAFYYDYENYQISEIVDRSAFNRNFDADVWGLEVEADWRPLENLRLGFKGGYESTRIADGEKAIDLMDRTAGRSDWVTVSPFPTFASNCILPAWLFVGYVSDGSGGDPTEQLVNVGSIGGGGNGGCELAYVFGLDPVTQLPYEPDPTISAGYPLSARPGYPGWNPLDESQGHNNGEGFFKDLGGNELPNAPNLTATVTADYTLPLANEWLMTLHTDLYYQSEAWTRVFNMEGYDKLKAYTNVNLAAIFTNEDAGWKVMAYVKNVFDRDSITGAFLNSDDTGLTTNVFLTEPRLYGLRVTKEWSGAAGLGAFGERRDGPYPLTLELGGQVTRHDAANTPVAAAFLSAFPAGLDSSPAQNRKLDWGDGREVKLSFRPSGSPWIASLDWRYSESNKGPMALRLEQPAGGPECGSAALPQFCDPDFPSYQRDFINHAENWSDTDVYRREQQDILQFQVGRDVGLGQLGQGMAALGMRFARFQSEAMVEFDGIPNWYLPENWAFLGKYSHHDRYMSHHTAAREFEGVGPMAAFSGETSLLGSDATGKIGVDWAAAAGILFGKRKTWVTGEESSGYWSGDYRGAGLENRLPPDPDVEPVRVFRSTSAAVPLAEFGIGLSYTIDRIKIGAGYRWERYFDVIDGGYGEEELYDRTIDGPYFKLAVGFGG